MKENNNIEAKNGNCIYDKEQEDETASAYVFGKHDKYREGGVGAYCITLIFGSIKEHFTAAYKTEMDTINFKMLAMTEVFKLGVDREIKQLNLYYDDERLKDLCVGNLRCNSLNSHNLKSQYKRFKNFGEVNFIKVDEKKTDYYRDTIKLTMEAIYRVR